MSDLDKIKDRIAKLLRLGQDGAAADGEMENAMRMAAQLMAKHQITRDDIDLDAMDPLARMQMGQHFGFFKGAQPLTWEIGVVWFVVEFIGTVKVYTHHEMPLRRGGVQTLDDAGAARTGKCAAFYGPDEDAEAARRMFEEVRDSIAMMAIMRYAGYAKGDGAVYAEGFTAGLRAKYRDAREQLKLADATTCALMIRNDEMALAIAKKADTWLQEEAGIKLGKSRGKRRGASGSFDARAEGYRDGQNYDASRPATQRKLSA